MNHARLIPRSLLVLCLLGLAGGVRAEDTANRPESARRLVRHWDFEERPGNVEPVPRDWFRNQNNPPASPRPGFPAWNTAGFDDTISASGETSVRLPTRGGCTALTLSRGVLAVMPGARYQVTAMARTEGLVNARALLSARLLDVTLTPIPGTEAQSEAVETGGAWRPVSAMLPGHQDGAWLQIDLELLQASRLGDAPLRTHEVQPQDYSGAAWFDDVKVFQVPVVDLEPAQHAGVAVMPDSPQLRLRVQDLTGESLTASVKVLDIDERVVDELVTPVESGGRVITWNPRLELLGWYRAELQISGPGGLVAERSTRFVWLPARGSPDVGLRWAWGLNGEAVQARHIPMLPALTDLAGTGSISLTVWSHVGVGPAGKGGTEGVELAVNRLLEDRQDVTFVMGRAPENLAREARIDPDDPLALLAGPDDSWSQGVSPLLSRFGERVTRWQVGPTGSDRAFLRTDLAADLKAVRRGFRGLVPHPTMTAPWRIDQSLAPARGVDALTVLVPDNIDSESLPLFAAEWSSSGLAKLPELTLVISPPSAEQYGRLSSVEALARRAVSAWEAGAARLAIDIPWTFDGDDAGRALPNPELAVWRTLSQHLGGRRPAGSLPVGTGIVAWLAQAEISGAVIAWNAYANPADAALRGYLGPGPITVTDMFGNTRPADPLPGRPDHVLIPLGSAPLFVEGVDVNLLRLRAGVKLTPAYIPARAERYELNLEVTNPWRSPVTGAVRLAEPVEWEMSPRVIAFALKAGETRRFPFNVALGVGEQSGARTITAELDLTSDRRFPTLRLELPVEVGLDSIQMLPSFRYVAGAGGMMDDVMVSLLVTNLDEQPVTLEAFVRAPGLRAQQAPISSLAPGESAVRRFVFPGAAKSLRGKYVLTGLKEVAGTGRLNKPLLIQ